MTARIPAAGCGSHDDGAGGRGAADFDVAERAGIERGALLPAKPPARRIPDSGGEEEAGR